MSQQGVLNYLKRNRGWKTKKQIAEALGIELQSVHDNMRKLSKEGFVVKDEFVVPTSVKIHGREVRWKLARKHM